MKRILAFLVLALVGTSVSLPAKADERIQLTVSRSTVIMGSETNVTPNISSIAEASSYNWLSLRFEVLLTNPSVVDLSFTARQSSQVACAGVLVGSGNLAQCSGTLKQSRTVINSGTVQASVPSSGITFVGNATHQFEAYVTAWLDVNLDGRISPYEPKSELTVITFLPASDLEASLAFEVDPPSRLLSGVSAWLTDSTGRENWGRGISSLVDLQRFQILVESCVDQRSICHYGSYSPIISSHPQLNSYRFDLPELLLSEGYANIRLAYFDTAESFVILGEEAFDYSPVPLGKAQTRIEAVTVSPRSNLPWPFDSQTRNQYLADNQTQFAYSTRFTDSAGKPLSSKLVHVKVDSTNLGSASDLKVDGRQITPPGAASRDIVWLERITDANGEVRLEFQNLNPVIWQSLEISSRLSGHDAHYYQRGGYVERVTWVPSDRQLKLEINQTSGTSLTATATLQGPTSYGSKLPVVQFRSGKNVLFENSWMRFTGGSNYSEFGSISAQNTVRMRIKTKEAGVETLTAKVWFDGQPYEASIQVAYDGRTGQLAVITQQLYDLEPQFTLESSGSQWRVRIDNAQGQRVSIRAGSRWYSVTPTSNKHVFSVGSIAGKSLTISAYVNGFLEFEQTTTIRR